MRRLLKRKVLKPCLIVLLAYLCFYCLTHFLYTYYNVFVIHYKSATHSTCKLKEIGFDKTYYHTGFDDAVKCTKAKYKTIQSTICGNVSDTELEMLGNLSN